MLKQYIPADVSLDVINQVSSEYKSGAHDRSPGKRENSTKFRESDQSFDANESITPVKEPRYGERRLKGRKQESNEKLKTNLINRQHQNKILINQRRVSEPADFSPRRPQGQRLDGWNDDSNHGNSFNSLNLVQDQRSDEQVCSPLLGGPRFAQNEPHLSQKYLTDISH